MDALGIESAAVVGNSMGGFVSAELAIKFPERVQRLVFVSAAIFWQNRRRAQPLVQLARLSDAVVARALVRATDDIATRRRLRYAALATAGFRYPQYVSDELAHEMVRSARRTDGFLPALEALAGYDLEEELPKISCPTLIVWGAHDQLVSVKDAERLRGPDPRLAARGLRAHRPRGDARAAGALQPAAAGVPRRGRHEPR